MTIADDVKSLEEENARLREAVESAVNPDDLVLVREALQQVLQLVESLMPEVQQQQLNQKRESTFYQTEKSIQEAEKKLVKNHLKNAQDQRYTVTEIGGDSEQQPAIYKLNSGDVLDGHTE